MKVMMLLLLSTVALLVSTAVVSPVPQKPEQNLSELIKVAERYNKSLTMHFFVEDVEPLFDAGCKDEFFCKVHNILRVHEHFGKRTDQEEDEIVRNLGAFVRNRRNPNCTVLLHTVPSTTVKKPIPDLLKHLVNCIQKRNLNGV